MALLVGPPTFAACRAPTSDVEVLLIGDSITAGFISGPEGLTSSCVDDHCWAARLATQLGQRYRVIKRAVRGATTRDWVGPTAGIPFSELDGSRVTLFDGLVARDLPVDIVVILLGTNDAGGFLEDAPFPPSEYARNLELLTRRLLDLGTGRVVLVPPPPQHDASMAVQLRLVGYRAMIERLCRGMSNERIGDPPAVVCGPDLLDRLGPEDFEKDDVHPNAQGHRRIAEAVAETIEALSRCRARGGARGRDPESDLLGSPSDSPDSPETQERQATPGTPETPE